MKPCASTTDAVVHSAAEEKKDIQFKEVKLVIGQLLEEQDCVAGVIRCAVGGCHASWADYSEHQWGGRCPRLVEGTEYKLSDTKKSGKGGASAFTYLLVLFLQFKDFICSRLSPVVTPLCVKKYKSLTVSQWLMRRYPLGRHLAPYSIDPAPSHRSFTAFTVGFTGFSSCLYASSINREIRSDGARPEVYCKKKQNKTKHGPACYFLLWDRRRIDDICRTGV